MLNSERIPNLAIAIAGYFVIATSLMAQIAVVNTASLVSPEADDAKTAVLSFDAGAVANKLVVQVSAVGQDVASITYHGIPLTEAVGQAGRNKGIFYLDNPFTGGAADLVVALAEGDSIGIAVGVVSISGAAPGVTTAAAASGGTSVTLSIPVPGSFVVCGYAADGSGTINPHFPALGSAPTADTGTSRQKQILTSSLPGLARGKTVMKRVSGNQFHKSQAGSLVEMVHIAEQMGVQRVD